MRSRLSGTRLTMAAAVTLAGCTTLRPAAGVSTVEGRVLACARTFAMERSFRLSEHPENPLTFSGQKDGPVGITVNVFSTPDRSSAWARASVTGSLAEAERSELEAGMLRQCREGPEAPRIR